MLGNEASVVMVSRLLTPEDKSQLLAWARLAYAAENSVRKLLGFDFAADGDSALKPREHSLGNILQESEIDG